MNDSSGVRLRQCVGERHGVLQRLRNRQPLRADHAIQCLAVDELHDDVVHTAGLADIVDGNDVGMVQRRGGLGLPHEPASAFLVGSRPPVKHLDGN